MLLALAAAAAESSDPTVGIIAAIGALLTALLTALGLWVKNADTRADKYIDQSKLVMASALEDARAGEEQLRKERDEARAHTAAAYKERDKWMEMWAQEQARANALEVRLTIARHTQGRSDDAT